MAEWLVPFPPCAGRAATFCIAHGGRRRETSGGLPRFSFLQGEILLIFSSSEGERTGATAFHRHVRADARRARGRLPHPAGNGRGRADPGLRLCTRSPDGGAGTRCPGRGREALPQGATAPAYRDARRTTDRCPRPAWSRNQPTSGCWWKVQSECLVEVPCSEDPLCHRIRRTSTPICNRPHARSIVRTGDPLF